MTKNTLSLDSLLELIKQRDPHETEFVQAATEILETVIPFAKSHDKYNNIRLFERLIEPERVIQFRVPWVDDDGNERTNRGFRVQYNNALGPYKGGLRFHPSVNLSILKFLSFEQVFKNSLTGLPLGGGKGGSDFNPKGKSNREIKAFCQSFITELYRFIGSETDIPAGDIGVGSIEIGYMFGQYKRMTNTFNGVLTGKAVSSGGSKLRNEATGYGLVYFLEEMLHENNEELDGKKVLVSGSGNVAQFAAQKAMQMGAKVITMSDSDGTIYCEKGLNEEQFDTIIKLKNEQKGRLSELDGEKGLSFINKKPWDMEADIALPCATQNEITEVGAQNLIENGIKYVAEGANMPCTNEAIALFHEANVYHAPGKASNAGGVSVSGLEMAQNAQKQFWDEETVDKKLRQIMKDIHSSCRKYGKDEDYINYLKGANIAGFIRVAEAMISQGQV